MRSLPANKKNQILKAILAGERTESIAIRFRISQSAVWRLVPNHLKRGSGSRRYHAEPEPMQPEGLPASCGIWRIKDELARSLSAMFRYQSGLTPDQAALDRFVSELIEKEISDFRLTHSREVFSAFGKPVLKITP